MNNATQTVLDRVTSMEAADIYSFDLFDTLIYRRNLAFNDISGLSARYGIGLLARNGGQVCGVGRWQYERGHVTGLLKGSFELATEEPPLLHIFKKILFSRGLKGEVLETTARELEEFEFGLDLQSLYLIDGARKVLEDLAAQGKRIIAVSDMYYSQAQIEAVLQNLGVLDYFERVFVSSEVKKTKQTANLFHHAMDELGIHDQKILHIGDNWRSDIVQAKKAGLNTMHVPEQALERTWKYAPEDQHGIDQMVAKMTLCYLYDLAMRCWEHGVETLFFLSRDATRLHEIMLELRSKDPYLKKLLSGLGIRELHVSRASTVFLQIRQGEETLGDIFSEYSWLNEGSFPLSKLMGFLGIQEKIEGLAEIDLNSYQVSNTVAQANEISSDYPELARAIVAGAQAHNERAIAYLTQEQVIGRKTAFADIGYTGTISRKIAFWLFSEEANSDGGDTRMFLFFLASGKGLHQNCQLSEPYVVVDNRETIKDIRLPAILAGNFAWLECFYKDFSRGPLISYRQDEKGVYVGDFQAVSEQPASDFSLRELVVNELEGLSTTEQIRYASQQYRDQVVTRFLATMASPDKESVQFVASLTQGIGPMDGQLRSIVDDSLGIGDFSPLRFKKKIEQDYWGAGSLVASGYAFLLPTYETMMKSYRRANGLRHRGKDKLKKVLRRWR